MDKNKETSGLLTRDDFKRLCMERDNQKCRLCGFDKDLSVHHIIERKLWSDGGYYISNGITVCPRCHIQVEGCFVMPSVLWEKIGVKLHDVENLSYLYPDGCFELDTAYDKWMQEILYEGHDGSFIVIPNQFKDKFEKAVRLAGGAVRNVNSEWLKEHMDIECKNNNALFVGMTKKFNYERNQTVY